MHKNQYQSSNKHENVGNQSQPVIHNNHFSVSTKILTIFDISSFFIIFFTDEQDKQNSGTTFQAYNIVLIPIYRIFANRDLCDHMDSRKKILVLINPISGTSNKDYLPETIRQKIDTSLFNLSIRFTQRPNHAYQLAKEAATNGYYGVIAVGGDGTVNETASALCGTETALGIVPNGSGNGLARHLGIPLNIAEALTIINSCNIKQYDYCTANQHPFFCTCGVGFDAQVSAKFAKNGKRGPFSYVKSAVLEYLKYRPQSYKIITPDGVITEKAFIIACGNASQYGNNAYITPNADMQDGLIDVTVILPITPFDTAILGILLFSKHIDQDTNIISFRTPSLTIERVKSGIMHLDGETVMMPENIEIKCHHLGLNVFTPEKRHEKSTIFNTIETGFWDFVNSIRSELKV